MLDGPHIVLTNHVAAHPESVETLFLEKDPRAVHDNLALTLGHNVQPLTAALVRLPDVNLGPTVPENILLPG